MFNVNRINCFGQKEKCMWIELVHLKWKELQTLFNWESWIFTLTTTTKSVLSGTFFFLMARIGLINGVLLFGLLFFYVSARRTSYTDLKCKSYKLTIETNKSKTKNQILSELIVCKTIPESYSCERIYRMELSKCE